MDVELNETQLERIDEIYNSVYEMCKVIANDESLEWDMSYIGEIAEDATYILVHRLKKPIYFPSIVYDTNFETHVEDYYRDTNNDSNEESNNGKDGTDE